MRIAACLVTRGDHDLSEIIESIPSSWEVVVWDNSKREDLAVYGRYAAIELTDAEIIYVQDDDAVLEPGGFDVLEEHYCPGHVTANMPARFRHEFYRDHCLVGFGALFDRELPAQAFSRFVRCRDVIVPIILDKPFQYACDIVFTTLTPRLLVDVEHRDLPWASDSDRMWKQPNHQADRSSMLQRARSCL